MSKKKFNEDARDDPKHPQKRQNGSNNHYEQDQRPRPEQIPPKERSNLRD